MSRMKGLCALPGKGVLDTSARFSKSVSRAPRSAANDCRCAFVNEL
jgi:hypothetical protein